MLTDLVWKEMPLSNLCEFINGYAFKPSDWDSLGKPIIRIQNLNGGKDFNYYKGFLPIRYTIEPGTLLFAWSGNRGTSFGPFIWKGQTGLLNQHIFKVIPKKEVNENWFYYALDEIRQRVEKNAHGAIGLVHVRKQDLEKYKVHVPMAGVEQHTIATILDTLDITIQQTQALIAKLKQVKAGMLHDLLTRGLDDKGELRDPIRHPEQFKDSPLGKIPKGWKVRSMEELTLKIVDGVHHTPNYVATGIPFIVITDLTSNNRITFQNTRFISEKDHLNFIKRADPQPGDVLVTKDGTLGVARLVPFNAPGFSIFVSVAMLRPNLKECCPDLIRSFFDSDDFLIQLRTLSAGSGLAHIHLEHFRKFQIRRPPIDEQVNIFKITQKQDDLLKNVLDDLKKLNLLKQALMQDLLTGKVRVPENMMEAMP